jgi:hypothetical protein
MRSIALVKNHDGKMFPATKFGNRAPLTFRFLLRDNAAKRMK